MSALDDYLKTNREHAYKMASANTPHGTDGRPVIPEGDEWRKEKEWDEMFLGMAK